MEDLTITCMQCGNDFIFTAGEQSYYEEHGFTRPKRCPLCRKNKARGNTGAERHNNRKRRDD